MKTGQPAEIESSDYDLDSIFKSRYGGATNIRGIRYQIIYSLLRAFDLYDSEKEARFLQLEGIEDIDLLGLKIEKEYIQVKTSINKWGWNEFKDVIPKFIKVFKTAPDSRFTLVLGCDVSATIEDIINLKSLGNNERQVIENKFIGVCRKEQLNNEDAIALLRNIQVVQKYENDVKKELFPKIIERFGLGSESVYIYAHVLISKFLQWAETRKKLDLSDMENVRMKVGEALSREGAYEAYGRGLIDKVSWKRDEKETDFFDGKGTRPGHIFAELDIERSKWIKLISEAIEKSGICVIRSSSGQGKSTLMYRFAYENWDAGNTLILKLIDKPEQIEIICNYFKTRTELGLTDLLLIDDAGVRKQYWPDVAQQCASLGIKVLVTIRNEDWFRFSRESLTSYEIIEPFLDIEEAKGIYEVFNSRGKVDGSIESAQWAFEKISEPKLLMEYVYFITHGQMLEARLREQIRQFHELNDDPAKSELLRRITLAQVLGASIRVDNLFSELQTRDDPQLVLQSLVGEYVTVEDSFAYGLHWVRSDHLVRILHENYTSPVRTALSIIEAVEYGDIPILISNVMLLDEGNIELLIDGILEKTKDKGQDLILVFLKGLYEGGEKCFFRKNKDLFDEAYQLLGTSGTFMLSTTMLPIIELNTMSEIMKIMNDGDNSNLKKLEEIASRTIRSARGLTYCERYLLKVNTVISIDEIAKDLKCLGDLLDWYSLTKIKIPNSDENIKSLVSRNVRLDSGIEAISAFAQGLFKYDEASYMDWYTNNKDDLLGFLKFSVDCIKLDVSGKILSFEYFVNTKGHFYEQTEARLSILRSAIPFCERYQSQGVWLLPLGLKPSVDDTHKDIPRENMPFKTDIEKNGVFVKEVSINYIADSYYKYVKGWHELRYYALLFCNILIDLLKNRLEERRSKTIEKSSIDEITIGLSERLRYEPNIPKNMFDKHTLNLSFSESIIEFSKNESLREWSSSYGNFFNQVVNYLSSNDIKLGGLVAFNFNVALKNLPGMHDAFLGLFRDAPDYFNTVGLATGEMYSYNALSCLLEAWIEEPPETRQKNILKFVMERRERREQGKMNRVKKELSTIEDKGTRIIYPKEIYLDYPGTYFLLGFQVKNPLGPENDLMEVLNGIYNVRDVVNYFYLIPLYKGKRYTRDGYKIGKDLFEDSVAELLKRWEGLVPIEISERALSVLPQLEYQALEPLTLREKLYEILNLFEIIDRQSRIIAGLGLSRNQFEIQLLNHHQVRIENEIVELEEKIRIFKGNFESLFGDLKGTDDFLGIVSFIELVLDYLEKDEVKKAAKHANSNGQDIRGNFDNLCVKIL